MHIKVKELVRSKKERLCHQSWLFMVVYLLSLRA